jgi:AcrR family transcriptional regulator
MASPSRRPYHSPLRRQRAAETRERIIAAGSELAHGFPTWSWRDLTVASVARRAGVDVRTVYRHFANERELREAVMRRLEEEAGVTVEELRLEDFAEVTARVFAYLDSFATTPKATDDPTFVAVDQRRRDALLSALLPWTAGWSRRDREIAAAVLDVLWSVPTYERFRTAWGFDATEATRATTWVIDVLREAIQAGVPPAPRAQRNHTASARSAAGRWRR